jgi:hypothetical protein
LRFIERSAPGIRVSYWGEVYGKENKKIKREGTWVGLEYLSTASGIICKVSVHFVAIYVLLKQSCTLLV